MRMTCRSRSCPLKGRILVDPCSLAKECQSGSMGFLDRREDLYTAQISRTSPLLRTGLTYVPSHPSPSDLISSLPLLLMPMSTLIRMNMLPLPDPTRFRSLHKPMSPLLFPQSHPPCSTTSSRPNRTDQFPFIFVIWRSWRTANIDWDEEGLGDEGVEVRCLMLDMRS